MRYLLKPELVNIKSAQKQLISFLDVLDVPDVELAAPRCLEDLAPPLLLCPTMRSHPLPSRDSLV